MKIKTPVHICFCQKDPSKIKVLRDLLPNEDWEKLIEEAYEREEYPRFILCDEDIGEHEYALAQTMLDYSNTFEGDKT